MNIPYVIKEVWLAPPPTAAMELQGQDFLRTMFMLTLTNKGDREGEKYSIWELSSSQHWYIYGKDGDLIMRPSESEREPDFYSKYRMTFQEGLRLASHVMNSHLTGYRNNPEYFLKYCSGMRWLELSFVNEQWQEILDNINNHICNLAEYK